jgi:hypothetical protein
MPTSTLAYWDKEFDNTMRPIIIPEKRGKGSKVTPDMVRTIIEVAKQYEPMGRRIRLQSFTRMLGTEKGIFLSSKTVGDILTANDLRSAKTRQKRPGFYQKLRQQIPNGLVSVDGSEIAIHIDDQVIKLNLEMAVDTNSFAHTAFSISKEETSEEFIKVLKAHCQQWGVPLGIVSDHGSANMSDASRHFLDRNDIRHIPAGPANPKGNGTIEGAFSQFKKIAGTIRIDTSSPEALAESILQIVVSVYTKMRNRMVLARETKSPAERMSEPVSEKVRDNLKEKLQSRIDLRKSPADDQRKIDFLHILIKSMKILAEPAVVQRAEKTITSYNMKAIHATEEAFVKAVNRKRDRSSLAYFFGILKRIQQEHDDHVYERQCQKRYNYDQMKKRMMDEQEEMKRKNPPTVENILDIIFSAFNSPQKFIKDIAFRKAQEWIAELVKTTKYVGTLGKKFKDSLAGMSQLESDIKEKMWLYVEELLNRKTNGKSVTLFS